MLKAHELREHQHKLLQSTSKYILIDGGVGTFKTTSCIYRLYNHLRLYHGQVITIAAQTFPQLVKAFLAEWKRQIPLELYNYNISTHIITIPALSAELRLQYADNPRAVENIRSESTSGWYLIQGESLHHTEFFDEMNRRVRLFGPEPNPAYIRLIDANPGSPSHFIYDRFIDAKSKRFLGGEWVKTRSGAGFAVNQYENLVRISIETTPETSAYSAATLAEWKRSLPAWQYDRMARGRWIASEGQIYSAFDRRVHVKEFDPDPTFQWHYAIDFGYRDPFVCLWIAQDRRGVTWILDEYYVDHSTIDIHSDAVATKWPDLPVRTGIADPADPNARLMFQKRLKELGRAVNFISTNKDITYGISLCQRKVHVTPDRETRLVIHPRCVNLISEIERYEWTQSVEGRAIREMPRPGNDHALDAWRYFEACPYIAKKSVLQIA